MEVLLRIKRLVLQGRVRFTEKARDEMETNELDSAEVIESIVNAQTIDKILRSHSERSCLASGGGHEGQVRAEELDDVLAPLVAGDGQAGQDFPGLLAARRLVATGELAGDHRRA